MKLNIKNLVAALMFVFSTKLVCATVVHPLMYLNLSHLKLRANIPNLSGQWKLNTQNSSFGKVPLSAAYETMEMLQTKDSISIMEFDDTGTKQTIALIGTTSTKSVKNKRAKKSIMSWINDNQTMVQNSSFEYEAAQNKPHQVGAVEVYKLSKGGKTLTVERSVEISDPKLNWKIIAVYDRVK